MRVRCVVKVEVTLENLQEGITVNRIKIGYIFKAINVQRRRHRDRLC